MDPQMQQFINSIPGGAPQQPQVQDQPIFQPQAAPMFPAAPAAPMMNQPPVPGGQFNPQTPTWPQMPQQPYTPPAPQVPGMPFQQQQTGTIFQQPGQQVQQGEQQQQNGIPLVLPQLGQQPQQQQPPDWAQELITQVQQLQNQGPQDNQPWDEQHRPKTWAELQQSMEKMANDKATEMVQGLQTQQQQEAQVQQQQRVQADQNLDMVEGQLQQMGMLPAVTNANDPNDPGKAARKELYAYAMSIGVTEPQQLGPAASTLYALHQSGQYFDQTKRSIVQRNSMQPGAFAPIAGAGATMAGGQIGAGQQVGPTVRQLASMPLSNIANMGARALGLQ